MTEEYTKTLQTVGDTNRRLSHRDLRHLSDIGREYEQAFFDQWQTIDLKRRREIVKSLVEMAEENTEFDFRDVFTACLDDADATVRQNAVEGLWDDDRPRTLRRLLSILANDNDVGVRAATALALGQFAYHAELGDLRPEDVTQLRTALVGAANNLDLDVEVRRRAVESSGYFHGSDVDEAIARAYAGGNDQLKGSALAAIGHSLDPRWLPILQAELGSATPHLRYEAARATGEFGEQAESLVPQLLPLVDSDDSEIFSAAIWALGEIGGDAARRTLRRLVNDENPVRQEAASEALSELDFNADPSRLF